MKRLDRWAGGAAGLALVYASWRGWAPFGWTPPSLTEALGFVTGALCVYLVVRENVWNFPVGIANSAFFLVLFAGARLYGDAALQIVYIALGFQGWHLWLRGGRDRTPLKVGRASRRLLVGVAAFVVAGTVALTLVFRSINDSAPFLDAFTTVLSLGAQYLLNRKAVENWLLWMTADVCYIYLYFDKGLRLTAVLYFVFLCLCVAGLRAWLSTMSGRGRATEVPAAVIGAGGGAVRG
ncbi:MAG TPA: nicotinamide riboside transporter PnuC [Pyrinomonadaceae bacterium]|nr:nicotinamide riboside transporter PnuC [Pyrinomonadaceae bacterium]